MVEVEIVHAPKEIDKFTGNAPSANWLVCQGVIQTTPLSTKLTKLKCNLFWSVILIVTDDSRVLISNIVPRPNLSQGKGSGDYWAISWMCSVSSIDFERSLIASLQVWRGWRVGVYTVHCSITPVWLLSSGVMLVLTPFNHRGDPALGVGGMKCDRCQVKIGTPEYGHPGCPFSHKYRHPDAYIYVNMGIPMPIFTVNMGIPPWK